MTQTENEKEMFAFVIMPFEPEFDSIYADLIVPALESAGYEVRRADNAIDQQNILKGIVYNIDRADLIVAELTSLNPNVLYELGIAHGLLKPTVLLTQTIEDTPFDLRSYRMIIYSARFDEVKELKTQLREIARKLREGAISFGNPVSDFAPSILQAHETMERRPKPKEEAEPTETAAEEPGMLDFVVEAERSIQEIGERVKRIIEMNNSLNQKRSTRAAELEPIRRNDTPGSSARTYRVVKAMASDMIQYAQKIEAELPGFHDSWERFTENTTNLLSIVGIESIKDREGMMTLRSKMKEFQEALGQARVRTRSNQEKISQMTGLSRDLNRAVRRTMRAMDGIIEEFAIGESYTARLLNLLSERVETECAKA